MATPASYSFPLSLLRLALQDGSKEALSRLMSFCELWKLPFESFNSLAFYDDFPEPRS